ncbi:hypothetical protein BD413DRAFT_496674 [Trametes elegans]|nr:hypothetical protein BD413DRAFT_496674 [Trametes elegans]
MLMLRVRYPAEHREEEHGPIHLHTIYPEPQLRNLLKVARLLNETTGGVAHVLAGSCVACSMVC